MPDDKAPDNAPTSRDEPIEEMADHDGPSDESIVQTAAEAAEDVIFSQYRQSDVRDVDVTVSFEGGVLDVDVYLNAPEGHLDEEHVVQDAVQAAREAVDELFHED